MAWLIERLGGVESQKNWLISMRSEPRRILSFRILFLDAGHLVDIRILEYVSIMITVSASESTSESETRSTTGIKWAESGFSKVACEGRSIANLESGARSWDSGGVYGNFWDVKNAAMDSSNCLATFSLTCLPARDLRFRLQMIGGGIAKALKEEVPPSFFVLCLLLNYK